MGFIFSSLLIWTQHTNTNPITQQEIVIGMKSSRNPCLKPLPHEALQPQKNLRFCPVIKFAPCGMCNCMQLAGIEHVLFLRVEIMVWPITAGVKRWNERSPDGGPIDSNVISTILRQPHLPHESLVGSKLLSTRYPQSHALLFLMSTHKQSRSRQKLAPPRYDVNIQVNAKWVKSTVWHVMRCALIAAFPTAAVAKQRLFVSLLNV